ncbi:MAG: menaquinone biosynthesis protein [Nitrospirae bacterium]|nr:menaquinone biosynthesis protein [Nitrospirota bacterium]
MRPKVGHIQFLNCLPLYYGLVKSSALLDIELIKGTPTELNSLLINGDLDISPISSIEYARHHQTLLLFPEFTVSSDGAVKSIILISPYPIEKLSGKRVALTNTSSTSHVLLKFIMNEGYGIEPDYITCQPDLKRMLSNADAALLIGDIALKYYVNSEGFYLYDLGLEWKKLTGRKMVYAVWAVNRKFAEIKSELCKYVFEIFKKSMEHSMRHLTEIAEYASRWEPFSRDFLTKYFASLRFNFSQDYREGLIHFYKVAKEIGELKEVPELEFVNINYIYKKNKVGPLR